MAYLDKLIRASTETKSLLCVGLDPNPDLIPESLKKTYPEPEQYVEQFCREVIDATLETCCAYKPNLAFFEALGSNGLSVFQRVLDHIPNEKIVISDAKRGDIGSTATQYKRAFFEQFDTDALTLNPMMGFDTLDPFLDSAEKAVYCLTLTSNPGSFDLLLRRFEGRLSLAEYIADQLQRKMKDSSTHIGMVVGATHDNDTVIRQVLNAYPDASLLIPGIGSQGGRVDLLAEQLKGHRGIPLVSSSRSIIYAGTDQKDWKTPIFEKAEETRKSLQIITERYV